MLSFLSTLISQSCTPLKLILIGTFGSCLYQKLPNCINTVPGLLSCSCKWLFWALSANMHCFCGYETAGYGSICFLVSVVKQYVVTITNWTKSSITFLCDIQLLWSIYRCRGVGSDNAIHWAQQTLNLFTLETFFETGITTGGLVCIVQDRDLQV